MISLNQKWRDGLEFLMEGESLSFYLFFTLIFTECVYLNGLYDPEVAIPMTAILLGYVVNVVIIGWLKGNWLGYRKEKLFTDMYIIIFIILFSIGLIINPLMILVFTFIPVTFTALGIITREIQYLCFYDEDEEDELIYVLKKITFDYLQFVIVGLPCIIFGITINNICYIPIWTSLFLIIYFFSIPFISYYEECVVACTIFELAYEVIWNPEIEESLEEIEEEGENKSDNN